MATVQFSILPSFATLILPDSAPLSDAVTYILTNLRTASSPSPDIITTYCTSITNQFSCINVGELRQLTDADFRVLQIPAMLRIYLKHLVRGTQSGRNKAAANGVAAAATIAVAPTPTAISPLPSLPPPIEPFLQSLQNDFNNGQPFDMSLYKSNLDTLSSMGIETERALEALCITENKSVEGAIAFLFTHDTRSVKEKRSKAAERLGKQISAEALAAQQEQMILQQQLQQQQQQQQLLVKRSASDPIVSSPPSSVLVPSSSSSSVISESFASQLMQQELSLVRTQLIKERTSRILQVKEYKHFIEDILPLKIYSEYLKSVLIKEYILPVEMEQLTKYRTRNHIDSSAHNSTLSELGIESSTALESLVKKVDKNKSGPGAAGSGGNVQQPGDMDCVVCLDKPKCFAIFNCMHLCLCEDCANSWMQKKGATAGSFSQNCPICSKKITQIARIYV